MQRPAVLLALAWLALTTTGAVGSSSSSSLGFASMDGPPSIDGALADGVHALQRSGFLKTRVDGIGPGTSIVYPRTCTLSFLVLHEGALSAATAGHCVKENLPVIVEASGTLVSLGLPQVVVDEGPGRDYALVRLPSSHEARAHVWGTGGPCEARAADEARTGEPLSMVGVGPTAGRAPVPRAGILLGADATLVRAAVPAVPGDSGAPLSVGVGARFGLGIVTHAVVDGTEVVGVVATPVSALPAALVTIPCTAGGT